MNDISAPRLSIAERWLADAFEWLETSALADTEGGRASVVSAVELVQSNMEGRQKKGVPEEMAEHVRASAARIIHRLRHRLLNTWPDQSADGCVDVLCDLENLFQALADGGDAPAPRQFVQTDGGELVVQLAHDLRSPLTSILFLAETLRRGQSGDLNQLQARQLGLIYAAALGLSSISGDVIELARGGEGLVEDEPAPFSVGEVFESVKNMVQPLAEEKGLDLQLTHAVSDHWNGHPLALSRVLLNLTTNGLKFTESGYVEIGARATGLSSLEFWVKDSGPGIPSHARDTLFEMFRTSADRSRTQFSGTGLGLYICRDLVEKMGSELKYETATERGTRFFFELKLNPAGSF